MAEEKVSEFLKTGKDWSRLKTSVPGVFVLKLPAYKTSPTRLAVEINPVNESGRPTKRRGLILRTRLELEAFKEAFQYDKIITLMNIVVAVNPVIEVSRRQKDEDILEI